MSRVSIETFVLGPDETNCYLLSTGRDALVIDPGIGPDRLVERISEQGLRLEGVLLTHFHLDHIGGVKELVAAHPAPVYGSAEDLFLKDISLEAGGIREFMQYLDFPLTPIEPGTTTGLGQPLMVMATPGHTPGSLSYFFPAIGAVFVGDLIFMIGVGRTDLPRGSGPELIGSIRSRIFSLPDDTRIYSGHGPMTSVAHEKANNPEFQRGT